MTGNPTADTQWQLITILKKVDIHSVQGTSIFIALPTLLYIIPVFLIFILFLSTKFLVWYQIRSNNTWINELPQLQSDTKKRELLKNPTKIEEIQEKNLLTEIEPLQLAF